MIAQSGDEQVVHAKRQKLVKPISDTAEHILIVDDDLRILSLLRRFLQREGFRVTTCENAQLARQAMEGFVFDLLIVDVMMPGETGLEFTKSIRKTLDVPILMLTALSDVDNRILGLSVGADDYLPKPFDPRELTLRLLSILKRRAPSQEDLAEGTEREICFGDYVFTLTEMALYQNGEEIHLTDAERFALFALAKSPGEVIPREKLSIDGADGLGRAVDVLINRLRKKIEANPASPKFIQTLRGRGYQLRTEK